MKLFTKIVGTSLVIILCACASSRQDLMPSMPLPPPQPELADSSAQSIDSGGLLSDAELGDLLKRANSGEQEAAFRLWWHFKAAGDLAGADQWQLAAARSGHPTAQYNLWFDLKDKNDCTSKKQGLDWLMSAAESGHQNAKIALDEYRRDVEVACMK